MFVLTLIASIVIFIVSLFIKPFPLDLFLTAIVSFLFSLKLLRMDDDIKQLKAQKNKNNKVNKE